MVQSNGTFGICIFFTGFSSFFLFGLGTGTIRQIWYESL